MSDNENEQEQRYVDPNSGAAPQPGGFANAPVEDADNPDPDNAKCDGPCALRLDKLEPFLAQLKALDELVKGFPAIETA